MTFELTRITAEEMRIAAAGVRPLPVEQSASWDGFEQRCGRVVFGRYQFSKNGRPIALISLTEYDIRGVKCLWAKKGPVWLRSQSPANERALRDALVAEVRKRDPKIAFIRLHAKYSAPDLRDLLQSITYDRTILIDTGGGDTEKILASMPKDGRRSVRRSMKRMEEGGARAVDLTGISRDDFAPIYEVIEETARRDGFTVHPMNVYWNMLDALGPEHARLFGVEYEGAIVAWVLVLVNDRKACAYYGAHSQAARDVLASEYLDFWTAKKLGEEGVETLDLMGVDSTRVPDLYDLGIYKRRFAMSDTEVDGAWDLPVYPAIYDALVLARRGKKVVNAGMRAADRVAGRLRGIRK
ncbi:MAG: GNAT family N-acetyltransferase [Actinomycetaceae bacterium]|nr:GNAT family N-acetyltransferase [Actinomycetaceae bacterium]